MCHNPLLFLTASTASAQYDEEEAPPMLEGSSRFSLQTGWRYTPNTQFYDDYYSQERTLNLERARGRLEGHC